MPGHHLKPGYYYSKESTHELMKIDEESKIWIVPTLLLDYPVLLDYPEVKNTATGSFTYGDYGPARKEIQDILKDSASSTVGIFCFHRFAICFRIVAVCNVQFQKYLITVCP